MDIKELYYGKNTPVNQPIKDGSEYTSLCSECLELNDELMKVLSENDRKKLDRLISTSGRMSEIISSESYCKGFRDGVSIFLDALYGENENMI